MQELTPIDGAESRYDDDGNEIVDVATCEECGRSWNDAAISHLTPAPSGRCPFEYEHEYEDEDEDDGEDDDEVEVEDGFHAELRLIIEQAEGTPLAALIPQAEALLALPEESVAALVGAAQNMVEAASFGRTPFDGRDPFGSDPSGFTRV